MAVPSFALTSDAFTTLDQNTIVEEDRSISRKTARLSQSADAATSYNNKGKGKPNASGTVKRIRVVNLAPPRSLPTSLSDSLFSLLIHGIRSITSRQDASSPLPGSLQQMYQACEALISYLDKGLALHNALSLELEKCTTSIARELRQSTLNGLDWINKLVLEAEWYQAKLDLLRSILVYYDQVYLLPSKDHESNNVVDLAKSTFRKNIFQDLFFSTKVEAGVLEWVARERSSPSQSDPTLSTSRTTISSLISLLTSYSQYSTLFHQPFIKSTIDFYTAEADSLAPQLSATEFFNHCAKRIEEEVGRAREVLKRETMEEVVQATESCLLRNRTGKLAVEGIAPFMEKHNVQGLYKMYLLFSRVEAQEDLRQAFKYHIQKRVSSIILNEPKDAEMIPSLITFKQFIDTSLKESFLEGKGLPIKEGADSNKSFAYAAIDAFERGFARRKIKPAEMIAKYIDAAMRKGQRGASDEEFQKELNDALGLYRFTPDKDVFREFFTRGLAKRLLLNRSASDDFEKAVIKKLREEYDHEFGKGDDMFRDLTLSRDLTADFHREKGPRNLSVMVLQHSAWPVYKRVSFDLPTSMQNSLNHFEIYYKKKHANRQLEWYHSLATVTLTARFPFGDKELSVSLYQAVVLLLFDGEGTKLGYTEIRQRTNLNDDDLKRTLQSLALGKKRVLTRLFKKKAPPKDVDDTDEFIFNARFEDPKRNIHINSIQQETPEENVATTKHIDVERENTLDAAIVRLMKGKKKMLYETLKTETINAVKAHFAPSVAMIKKQIDSLVLREYLERDKVDMNLYRYVA